jgi:hypothetical protein
MTMRGKAHGKLKRLPSVIPASAPVRHSGMLLAGIQVFTNTLDPRQKNVGVTVGGTFLTRSYFPSSTTGRRVSGSFVG